MKRLCAIIGMLAGLGVAASQALGASGTWTNNAAGSWSVAGNWADGVIADGAGSTAWLTNNISTARIVTIDTTPRTLGGLVIGDADGTHAFTLAASGAGRLTFDNGGAGATLNQASSSRGDTISAPLALGDSTEIANASTNLLTISGTVTGVVAGLRTLSNKGSGNVTLGGAIGNGVGTVAVVQDSETSLLSLTAGNSFTGGLFIKSGTVHGSTTISFGAPANTVTLGDAAGSASAVLRSGLGGTHAQPIVVAGGNTGLAMITNMANAIFSGPVTLQGHGLLLASSANTLTLSGGVQGTGSLTLNANGTVAITLSTLPVNPAGTIVNTGSGSATVSITGGVGSNVTAIVEASTNSPLTVSTLPLTVNGGGTTLANNNPGGAKVLTVSGGVRGTGDLVLKNNSAIANGVTVATTAVTNWGRIVNAGSGSGNALVSAVIGTAVTAVVQASETSTLTLSGANLFTNGLLVATGTVYGLTSASAFGAATNLITLGAAAGSGNATLRSGVAGTHLNPIAVAAGNTGTATLTDNAASTFSGAVTLYDHALTLAASNAALVVSGGIRGTGNLLLDASGAGAITLSGPVTPAGAITNLGAGSATATLSGGVGPAVTEIAQGSLSSALSLTTLPLEVNAAGTVLANTGGSGGKPLTVSGGVRGIGDLVLRNNGALANGITFSGAAVTNEGRIVNSGAGPGSVLVGAIIGTNATGGVVQDGASPLILAAANLYAGGTVVESGVLCLSNAAGSATGPGPVDVKSGGALIGFGTAAGSVTLRDGGRISPGNDGAAGGTLAVSNLTWNGGGVFHCEIKAIPEEASQAGVAYDRLVVSNTLTAVPGGTDLVIRLDSLGQAISFDPARNYSLKLISCGTAAGLDPADVTLDTSLFLAGGGWFVTNMNKSIWVVYRGAPAKNFWIGSGSWSNAANWSLGHAPLPGEEVEFDWNSPANCAADVVSNNLQSITLAAGYAGTVTFATNAVEGAMHLVVGDLTINEGSVAFNCDPAAVGAGSPGLPFGVGYTVTVVNVSVAAGCSLNSDSKGFAPNRGPGKSFDGTRSWGASYGGRGGVERFRQAFPTAPCYGAAAGPTALGSGGNGNAGGGALKLIVSGTATVNGALTASSLYVAQNSSMGSGGSLWVTGGGTLQGTGLIAVNSYHGGNITCGGGGGRLDISGMVNNFSGALESRNVVTWAGSGLPGSILIPQSEGSELKMDRLILTNTITFGSSLTFANPVVVTNGGRLVLVANTNANVYQFTSLTIASNGSVFCQGNWAVENAEAGGSTNNPYGLGVTIIASNVSILAGGSLNADGGANTGMGPGYGTNNLSAGYGGLGALGHGATYGAVSNVTALGSGGVAGFGGGALRLVVSGTLLVDGTNSANGALAAWNNAAGSGGSLWIDCNRLEGAGVIAANGGRAANANAGGGGRVHLSYRELGPVNPVTAGKVTAYGGVGDNNLPLYKGAAGTVLLTDAGAGETVGTLIIANDLVCSNTVTLLPTNSDGYAGSPLTLTVDKLILRDKGILQVPADRALAVVSLFSNGVAFPPATNRSLLSFVAETNSILAFTGTNDAAVYGSNVFDILQVNAGVKTVSFEAGVTNRVRGGLVLDRATLRSTESGAWWFLNCETGAIQNVRQVFVSDSHAGGGALIKAGRGSSDGGHNVNWQFPGAGGLLIMVR